MGLLWLCQGLISTTASGSVQVAHSEHASGQWGLRGWDRLGQAAVGFLGAHGGRGRPELLPASMAGPGAQVLIPDDLHP